MNALETYTSLKPNILLATTDASYALLLSENLEQRGFEVEHTSNMRLAIERIRLHAFDLCMLQTGTMSATALQTLREIRQYDEKIPVLLLSEKYEKEAILDGYAAGCDEYVVTPVSVDVLECKLYSWLRRAVVDVRLSLAKISIGEFVLDPSRQTFSNASMSRHLSAKQTLLLQLLAQNKNKVVEREIILRKVWRDDSVFAARSLRVYINKLKQMFADIDGIEVLSVARRGYMLAEE